MLFLVQTIVFEWEELNLYDLRLFLYQLQKSHIRLIFPKLMAFVFVDVMVLIFLWCDSDIFFPLVIAAFDGEVHSIQLPPVNSASFVLRFLENLCHSLQCDNLLSSQPFSSYRGNTHSPEENDQNKPGKRKCKILYCASILP